MRIVIDLQGAQTESKYRGIGRYSLSLALALARNKEEHEIIIALNALFPDTIEPLRAAFHGLVPPQNIRIWHTLAPVRGIVPGNEWRRNAAEILRSAFLEEMQPDVVLITSLFEGYADDAVVNIPSFKSSGFSTFVVLYDLIPLLYPEKYLTPHPAFENYYKKQIASLLNADAYLAISESSAEEGIRSLGLHQESVATISSASDPLFRPLDISEAERKEILRRFNIQGNFVLYAGGADERKNLVRLIRAFALLPKHIRQEQTLVFAGRIPEGNVYELRSNAITEGLEKRELIFTGYVSDDDLARLYNLCSLFVLPSLHEGFGLPALEAMNCGAPVIGSFSSSIPEVLGWREALFDPLNEQSIAEKMEQTLTDPLFRKQLIRNAVLRASRFSWDITARRTIKSFEAHQNSKHIFQTERDHAIISVDRLASHLAHTCAHHLTDRDISNSVWSLLLNHREAGTRRIFIDISDYVPNSILDEIIKNIKKEPYIFSKESLYYCIFFSVHAIKSPKTHPCLQNYSFTFEHESSESTSFPIDFRAGDFFLCSDVRCTAASPQQRALTDLHAAGVHIFLLDAKRLLDNIQKGEPVEASFTKNVYPYK